MSKSLADCIKEEKKKYKTTEQTISDFPIGTKVQVITPCTDFCFFRGMETGVVTKNSGGGNGIRVLFDEPMVYENGWKRTEFGFDPDDLIILRKGNGKCPHCGI